MNETPTLASLLDRAAAALPELAFEAWHFGDSVAFDAGVAAARTCGRPELAGFLRGFARGWAARSEAFRPLDCTAPGHALVHLALDSGDESLLSTCVALADYLTTRRKVAGVYATWERSPLRRPYGPEELSAEDAALLDEPGAGIFVDCLHFDPPFFAALSRATGDARWADEAIEQAMGYVAVLQDAETGLFRHFHLERTGREYVLGWGRGQGWALLGLLDVIDELGLDRAAMLQEPVRRLIDGMLARQNGDGSWDAVAGVPASGTETSTAAFMAHGFRRAARVGVVDEELVADAVRAAIDVTVAHTNGDGSLRDVSVAVWACTLDTHYHHVPTGSVTPWGQGPLVLALLEAVALSQEPEPTR